MNINATFTYHAPHGTQQDRYERLRSMARQFATTIQACCPASAETTLALRDVQRATMMANAAIAINEQPPLS